jgi:hypothetical protein
MCPRLFKRKNPTVRLSLDLRRRSFRRFGISGIGSLCIPYLKLPSAEILKLWFTPPLNRTVNSFPTIYGVDRFGISGFGFRRCSSPSLPISQLCEIRKVFTTGSSATLHGLTVEPSSQIYRRISSWVFGSSRIAIPTLLFNSKGSLSPVHILQIRRSQGFAFLLNKSQGSNTSGVDSSLPVAIYHTDCGFTTPLYLLSL